MDEEAMERFYALPESDLKEDILQHIQKKQDGYYFMNRPDGSCMMLDPDGLCRIQRNSREEMLCITCRKFPRLAGRVQQDYWMSMAASCPVTAGYLWTKPAGWYMTDGEISQEIDWTELPYDKERREGLEWFMDSLRKQSEAAPDSMEESVHFLWNMYQRMYDLMEGCLELMASSPELSYLEGSFDYFEKDYGAAEIISQMMMFQENFGGKLREFTKNYMLYRVYSRCLEFPEESGQKCLFTVAGELFLFYILRFSRYHTIHRDDLSSVVAEINWMYRFCVHSKRRSDQFTSLLKDKFKKLEYLAEIIIRIF